MALGGLGVCRRRGVVVLDVWALAFCSIYIIPSMMQKIRHDGMLVFHDSEMPAVDWMFSWLDYVLRAWGMFWWLPWTLAALWGLFEWRVRGESKPFIRLSILGTAALALTATVVVTAGSVVLPTFLGFPTNRTTGLNVLLATARLDATIGAVDRTPCRRIGPRPEEDERMASLAVDGVERAGTQWLPFTPPEEKWSRPNHLRAWYC